MHVLIDFDENDLTKIAHVTGPFPTVEDADQWDEGTGQRDHAEYRIMELESPDFHRDALPEGLTLQYADTANFEPCIVDAQDMVWVHFPDHDTEDPTSWFRAFVRRTCLGLGVTVAMNENGDEVSVEDFIREWIGHHEGAPASGFTT